MKLLKLLNVEILSILQAAMVERQTYLRAYFKDVLCAKTQEKQKYTLVLDFLGDVNRSIKSRI